MDHFSREEFKNFTIGCIVVGIFALALVCFKIRHNVWKNAKDTDYTVYATFNRTDGLVVGDKVRMAGIDIGHIEKSVLDEDYRATLTLRIRDKYLIPDDSSASIVSSGIMGAKYIEIEPGGSEDFIQSGGEFSYTQDAMVLEELVDRIISLGKANKKSSHAKTEITEMEN